MKNPDLRKWSYSDEVKGLLVFAQAIEELLFDHTLDSYKATALNVHTSTLELRFLAKQLVDDRVPSGTLIPVIEELAWRIGNDPVLQAGNGVVFSVWLERLEAERTDPRALLAGVDALLVELNGYYWERIGEDIKKAVRDGTSNRTILELANVFIVEAELQGFSRNYIYHVARRFFFWTGAEPRRIESVDQLEQFLMQFYASEAARYTAVLRGSSEFEALADFAKEVGVTVASISPENMPSFFRARRFLGDSSEFPNYLTIKGITARDPNSARQLAESRVDILADLYSYYAHENEPRWYSTCLLINEATEWAELINASVSAMKRGTRRRAEELRMDMAEAMEVVKGVHLERESQYVFVKALDYHRAAIEATTPENQLLDLWAALEGFLPPPSKDSARITHFVGSLLPVLSLTYAEKIFRYVAHHLNTGGDRIREIVESVPVDGDFFTKTAAILTAEDAAVIRAELMAELSLNPLMRFRCFSVNEQFRTNERIRSSLLRHKQKVAWHIQRIYATRNQIVHSAEALPYLDTLVENLHFYLDTLMSVIVRVGLKSKVKISVPGALKLLSVHEQAALRQLEGRKERCTLENFKLLVFGHESPLNPFDEELALFARP